MSSSQRASRTSSSHNSQSQASYDSRCSGSTSQTSVSTSQQAYSGEASSQCFDYSESYDVMPDLRRQQPHAVRDDVSPATSLCSRSSVDTYASTIASEEHVEVDIDGEMEMNCNDSYIPPLPMYRSGVVEPNVQPSTPQDFAKLFPSLNRFTIRHDEFTSDGNMNLRVDAIVTGRRRTAVQLFHLRMYDLAKREFSLRRYCRESGREVCNSKRKYHDMKAARSPKKSPNSRPGLQRSVTTALRTLSGGSGKPGFGRTPSSGSIFGSRSSTGTTDRPSTIHSDSSDDNIGNEMSTTSDSGSNSNSDRLSAEISPKPRPQPTNTIKLEFSNYARVDLQSRGSGKTQRHEFEWWGHRYAWRRCVDKHQGNGASSFHLVRDGNTAEPVAHIVPETRPPAQIHADEVAGGWIQPCFMWIEDETVLQAATDVGDVIMATGLIALVDAAIEDRWHSKKTHHRISVPLTSKTVDVAPKALMQHVFRRRSSSEEQTPHHHHHTQPTSPLRYANPVSAY